MKKNPVSFSIIITLIVSAILGYIEIGVFKEYGWTVFLVIPFIIGFLPAFVYQKLTKSTRKECYQLSFLTLGIVLMGLLIFAIEGFICILMSLPLLVLLVWFGSYLGFKLSTRNGKLTNSTNTTIGLFIICICSMSFDYINNPKHLISVRTRVIVNSNIDNVWQNVVTFDKIEEPVEWIFKTGISYPTDATIKGTGVGAIRYCNFTTGSFVEPITTWNEPYLLQFNVKEQPIPMNEFNPFWDVHPPHLDGYFKSYKGQFKLTKIEENKTELEGTTWYKVDITPEIYWKTWSNFIIHQIHERVLNHIKKETEKTIVHEKRIT